MEGANSCLHYVFKVYFATREFDSKSRRWKECTLTAPVTIRIICTLANVKNSVSMSHARTRIIIRYVCTSTNAEIHIIVCPLMCVDIAALQSANRVCEQQEYSAVEYFSRSSTESTSANGMSFDALLFALLRHRYALTPLCIPT